MLVLPYFDIIDVGSGKSTNMKMHSTWMNIRQIHAAKILNANSEHRILSFLALTKNEEQRPIEEVKKQKYF